MFLHSLDPQFKEKGGLVAVFSEGWAPKDKNNDALPGHTEEGSGAERSRHGSHLRSTGL